MLLRKSCEGRFEIAIGSGIHDNELQAQRARRRLHITVLGMPHLCLGGLCAEEIRHEQKPPSFDRLAVLLLEFSPQPSPNPR
jgi:hypothetical protein